MRAHLLCKQGISSITAYSIEALNVQGKSVRPAVRKILDIYFLVWLRLTLTPKKKTFLCSKAFFTFIQKREHRSDRATIKITNLISAIVNRRINVHIIPRISFRFPSIISRTRKQKMYSSRKSLDSAKAYLQAQYLLISHLLK